MARRLENLPEQLVIPAGESSVEWSDGVTDQPLVTFTLRNHEGMEDVPFDKAKETTLKDMEPVSYTHLDVYKRQC